MLRPHGGGHSLRQTFKVDPTPVTVDGRGQATWVDKGLRRRDPSENVPSTYETLGFTHTAAKADSVAETRPNVGRDLKEIALQHTQEIIDAEKEVLHYTIFTREPVINSTTERERTRVYDLYYYAIDGTLRVFEPAQVNSGLMQVRTSQALSCPYILA